MLSGAQLAIAISAVLLAALLLGWILHWLWIGIFVYNSRKKRQAGPMPCE